MKIYGSEAQVQIVKAGEDGDSVNCLVPAIAMQSNKAQNMITTKTTTRARKSTQWGEKEDCE